MSKKKSILFKVKFLRDHKNIYRPNERERLYWFFREQFRFGHREILLDYISKDYSNLIEGFLQHGFHGKKLAPWQTLPRNVFQNYPVFVWNQYTELEARSKGQTHVYAIGAPWLYLLRQYGIDFDSKSPQLQVKDAKMRDVLIVPSHGSGHYHPGEDYAILPRAYRRQIGNAKASVLLYYTEFCDPHVRNSWRSEGFEIFSSGMAWGPEQRTLWTYNGGRKNFLHNTLETLSCHQNVICQIPTTLALYAISLGIPTKINTSQEIPKVLGIVDQGKGVDRLRRLESEMDQWAADTLGNEFNNLSVTEEKRILVANALGVNDMKSRAELTRMLPLKPGVIPLPEGS